MIVILLLWSISLLRSVGTLILHWRKAHMNCIRLLLIWVRCYYFHLIVCHLVGCIFPFGYFCRIGLLFLNLRESRVEFLCSTSHNCRILDFVDLQVVIDSITSDDQVWETLGCASHHFFKIRPMKDAHEHVYQFSF